METIYTQLSQWTVSAKPPKGDAWYQFNAGAKSFKSVQMSCLDFYNALYQGHGFRAAGSKEDLSVTNIIAYDFDRGDMALNDLLSGIEDTPLYTYHSYSSTAKHQRYRLIFYLSRPITPSEYQPIYEGLAKRNGFWDMIDRRAYSQFYFSGRDIAYLSSCSEIRPEDYLLAVPLTATWEASNTVGSDTPMEEAPKAANKPTAKATPKAHKDSKAIKADPELEAFIARYGALMPAQGADAAGIHVEEERGDLYFLTRTPSPAVTEDDPVIYTPEGYLHVPKREVWDAEQRLKLTRLFQDGEARYKIIYVTALILKIINPGITPVEHAKATILTTLMTVDYGDGKYTIERICRIAWQAYNAPARELKTKMHIPSYHVNELYCDNTGYNKRQVVGMTNAHNRKAKNYKAFLEVYDPEKTDLQNQIALLNAGIRRSTYFQFKKDYENGLTG